MEAKVPKTPEIWLQNQKNTSPWEIKMRCEAGAENEYLLVGIRISVWAYGLYESLYLVRV